MDAAVKPCVIESMTERSNVLGNQNTYIYQFNKYMYLVIKIYVMFNIYQ